MKQLSAEKMLNIIEYEKVRSDVYGMDYEDWKKKFQKPIDSK